MRNYQTSNDYVLQLQQQMNDIKMMMDNDLQQKKLKISSQATQIQQLFACLLYTSDAADERSSVDLGGRRIIKKKKKQVIK